jgi:hypothetical protein
MGMGALRDLAGEWELAVDLPGAGDVRGQVVFELLGEILVQRTTVPVPQAPDSCCVIVTTADGGYVQHYVDSRGAARLYAMTFDGRTWTLERTKWQSSPDARQWTRDFGLTYTRVGAAR